MSAAPKTKASDRQSVCKKLLTSLKKRYTGKLPKLEMPVLETMLFSACLENSDWESAEAACQRLQASFHDLNEVRVSSVKETEVVFDGLTHPDWRALRVRSVLQYVFEDTYSFEFEGLKRKTLDSANKQLSKVNHMTPFMRLFTLQQCLGSHVLPVDDRMGEALIWLGMAEAGSTPEQVADVMKSSVRKADAPLFCHLIRCLVTDPKYLEFFETINAGTPDESRELDTAVERLDRLFKRGVSAFQKPKKKRSAKKSATAKKVAKKTKTVKKKATKSSKTATKSSATPRKKASGKKVKVAKPKAVKKKATRKRPK